MKKFSKKWRKLSLPEKTSLLLSHYGINSKDIEKIRRIESGTERLIRAAKLQYELWKEYKVILPFTRTPERLAVLEGHIDIDALKKISQKRQLEKIKTP